MLHTIRALSASILCPFSLPMRHHFTLVKGINCFSNSFKIFQIRWDNVIEVLAYFKSLMGSCEYVYSSSTVQTTADNFKRFVY